MKHITIFKTTLMHRLLAGALGLLLVSGLVSAGSLIATWAPNSEADLAGYIVSYGVESGNYTEQVDVKNTNVFVANDLSDGEEYFFTVKAYDYFGNVSAPSAEVSAIVGGSILVALKESQTIRLMWTPVGNVDTYEIYRGHDPYFKPTTPVTTVSASNQEFVDTQHFDNDELETYYTVYAKSGGSLVHDFGTVGAYDVNLNVGLNLISLPLIPADPSLPQLIADQLSGGENSSEADQIRAWNGEEYQVAWLYNGPAAEYDGQWISAATGKESDMRINSQNAFWVVIQENHPETKLTLVGRVPDQPERTYELKQGYNFVGCGYPVPVELSKTELYQDGVMKGGVGSGEADIIKAWNGSSYDRAWVVDGVNPDLDGTWMDETGKKETTITFQPGEGYVIWIKGENSQKIWTFPNPALVE